MPSQKGGWGLKNFHDGSLVGGFQYVSTLGEEIHLPTMDFQKTFVGFLGWWWFQILGEVGVLFWYLYVFFGC